MDLDDALESLQNEPSGWGDLPSPRQLSRDNGTECWGVPPDDQARVKSKGKPGGVNRHTLITVFGVGMLVDVHTCTCTCVCMGECLN